MGKCPFRVAGQYVGPWFVGNVCEASCGVCFSDGVPSGISSSGWGDVCSGCRLIALCLSTHQKGTRKDSS